jgi:uncharacterized protein YdbL (DUF1318 family)
MDDSDLLSELDLADVSSPRLLGNLRKAFSCEHTRELTDADIAALSMPRGAVAPALVRIHSSHHALARCLASGMKASEASLITGYSQGRISILQKDATFAALVRDYSDEAKATFADLAERMSGLSLDAIEILHERLHANPETFSIPVLLDVVKTLADRTGHGPGQEVHLKVDRDFIDRPPRESAEEWKSRRARELAAPPARDASGPEAGPEAKVINLRVTDVET